ncbi:HNH/endonuclease VII fold putative polymorphic toxin, partial [Bacillus aquiflavi]
FIGNRLMPAYATGVVGTRGVRLAEEQIYRISGGRTGAGKKTGKLINASISHESRSASLKEIKRKLNIPKSQHPINQRMVPLKHSNGNWILDSNKRPIMTRELTYEINGKKIVIQDHSVGHDFGGIGNQPSHHNVRPIENTRTGKVEGMEDHYYFKKRNKK